MLLDPSPAARPRRARAPELKPDLQYIEPLRQISTRHFNIDEITAVDYLPHEIFLSCRTRQAQDAHRFECEASGRTIMRSMQMWDVGSDGHGNDRDAIDDTGGAVARFMHREAIQVCHLPPRRAVRRVAIASMR